jgi:glycosyltransferase involved in cell wall biosynthesis
LSVRVLVVHPRDPAEQTSGGIQTFLHDFIAHSPSDFDISFAGVTSDTQERPVGKWQEIAVGNHAVRFLPVGRSGSLLKHPGAIPGALGALRTLRREMRIPNDSILQLHRPYRASLLDGHTGPRVQFIHLDLDAWPGPSGWRRLSWLYRDFDADLDRFDRVFVANEAGAEKLRRENPVIADRVVFLSGWYDIAMFQPIDDVDRPAARARVCASLGLPHFAGEKWVLFVGRLDPIKDPELAVDTFAALSEASETHVRLIVCGDGEARGDLEDRVRERGVGERVSVLGEQPRETVAALMQAGDVLLVTSLAEGGGPRVVLEALGSGLPVVSTIVGEVRRSVRTGTNGRLVEERTPEALAAGISWSLAQPRDAVSAAAVAAAKPFQATAVLGQLYDAYRELAARGTAPR